LAGLQEIEVYFSYLDRIGLLKILFVWEQVEKNQFAKYTGGDITPAQQHQRP
jgi:hypothetical protein